MKKLILFAVATLFLLTSCANQIPNGYNEQELTNKSQQIVALVNDRDYQGIIDSFREDLQGLLTAGQLEAAWGESLDKAGAFVSFDAPSFSATSDGDTGETYAVVALRAVYEDDKHVFTISYDRAMDLVGLYMK